MVVGLGTGTTATLAVRRIGELIASGDLKDISGVPTSARTMALANELGISLATLSDTRPHLTIDGTDEVAPDLALIKGRGGALLREKIVASSSEEGLIVVADSTKIVDSLGVGPLPVEIDSFGWQATLEALASLGCEPELRMDQDGSRPPLRHRRRPLHRRLQIRLHPRPRLAGNRNQENPWRPGMRPLHIHSPHRHNRRRKRNAVYRGVAPIEHATALRLSLVSRACRTHRLAPSLVSTLRFAGLQSSGLSGLARPLTSYQRLEQSGSTQQGLAPSRLPESEPKGEAC